MFLNVSFFKYINIHFIQVGQIFSLCLTAWMCAVSLLVLILGQNSNNMALLMPFSSSLLNIPVLSFKNQIFFFLFAAIFPSQFYIFFLRRNFPIRTHVYMSFPPCIIVIFFFLNNLFSLNVISALRMKSFGPLNIVIFRISSLFIYLFVCCLFGTRYSNSVHHLLMVQEKRKAAFHIISWHIHIEAGNNELRTNEKK